MLEAYRDKDFPAQLIAEIEEKRNDVQDLPTDIAAVRDDVDELMCDEIVSISGNTGRSNRAR